MQSLLKLLAALVLSAIVYITPAHANPCGNWLTEANGDFEVFGEYLYWQVKEDQLQYAALLLNELNDVVNFSEQLIIKEQKQDWSSGFRVGFGYKPYCTDWNFNCFWTSLHNSTKSSLFDPTSQGVIPIPAIPSVAPGTGAVSHWHFKFDTLDFQLGRKFCLNESCMTLPFVGIKGAWIKQNQNIDYFGSTLNPTPIDFAIHKKNHFNSVGICLGVDNTWEFLPEFTLDSGISAAYLYGKFNVSANSSITQESNAVVAEFKYNKHRLRPMVDAYIGVNWSACLCECFLIDLGIDYEIQYWWNQWQAPSSFETALLNTTAAQQGDLVLHGLTVHLAVGF